MKYFPTSIALISLASLVCGCACPMRQSQGPFEKNKESLLRHEAPEKSFPLLCLDTAEERCELVCEGSYKVYDIQKDSKITPIIGPVCPCIAVVFTDWKKLVVFHKHYTNSVSNMLEIIQKNLDCSSPELLSGAIYTVRDDLVWEYKSLDWRLHGGRMPGEEVERIRFALCNSLHLKQPQVKTLICLGNKVLPDSDENYYNVFSRFQYWRTKRVLKTDLLDSLFCAATSLSDVECYKYLTLNFSDLAIERNESKCVIHKALKLFVVCEKIHKEIIGNFLSREPSLLEVFYLKNFKKKPGQYIEDCGEKSYDTQPFYPLDWTF